MTDETTHIATAAALRAALERIACQKRTDELVTACDVEYADFEAGYDLAVDTARAALAGEAPMTADLDLPPEAVERLAEALEAQEQADMDGTMVKVSRQACDEGAATLRALAAENERLKRIEHGLRNEAKDYHDEMHKGFDEIARLRAERDAAWQAGAEAMRSAAAASCEESWDDSAMLFYDRIINLPLPGQPKENSDDRPGA